MEPRSERLVSGRDALLAALLGVLLLALSCARIFGDAGSAAFGGQVINAAVAGPVWGAALGRNLILFALSLILVHVGFALACLGLGILSKLAWPRRGHSTRVWFLLWFTISTAWLLTANAALFPWSSLGSVHSNVLGLSWRGFTLFEFFTTGLVLAVLWLLLSIAVRHYRLHTAVLLRACAVLTALAGGSLLVQSATGTPSSAPQKPHVILIGLDSVRADVVEKARSRTPALHAYLDSAVLFADTTTPLARTFPSWVSLLTGRHPHTTGAVINLLPREMIDTGPTLPQSLAANGYRTAYAIDEVRFSNIDESYGFDTMLAPPIGATDFIIGFFGDTPLSNLLANTWLGELLFPYLHGNRAIAHAYDPDTFIERLDGRLEFDEPTFLAVHLTLAHWPYYWADAPQQPPASGLSAPRRYYDAALQRLDQQFADLMALLERNGALQNAIVIVVSDHGESLGHAVPTESEHEHLPGVEYEDDKLLGHGTSVFARSQYQVLFGVRSYGNTLVNTAPRILDAPVSLEDVTPTVLDLLGVQTVDVKFDGVSLAHLLGSDSPTVDLSSRIRFTETEFNPKGISPGTIITASAMQKAAAYYRVDPRTDRVLVRKELLDEVMQNRQFAALRDQKILASVPIQSAAEVVHQALLMEGSSPPVIIEDPAQHSDPAVQELWSALQRRFPEVSEFSRAHQVAPESFNQHE